jgi:hypothetical protein
MLDLPEPWAIYARWQAALMGRDRVDDVTWGLEAGLNRCLDQTAPAEDVTRAVAAESRRERYRQRLRSIYLSKENEVPDCESAVIAAERLEQVRASVSEGEWELLRDVAEGKNYRELAASSHSTPGALRIRTMRLRLRLRAA